MSNPEPSDATPPFLSPAPDYVPADPAKAWERFERLVGKVLDAPKPSLPTNPGQDAKIKARQGQKEKIRQEKNHGDCQ